MGLRLGRLAILTAAVVGISAVGAFLLDGQQKAPSLKASVTVGSTTTLAKSYGRWKAQVFAQNSQQNLVLSLRPAQGHATGVARAKGLATFNLGSGELDIEIQGLENPGSHAVWLMDKAENTGSTSKTVKLGRLSGTDAQSTFRAVLDASALAEFQLDMIAVTGAEKRPEDGVVLAGSPSLFHRLFYNELRGDGIPSANDNAAPNPSDILEDDWASRLAFLVPRPAFAQTSGDPADLEALIAEGENLFFNETFAGNGRTCGTCHALDNNFTIDPAYIATLGRRDRLFVAEYNKKLPDLENPALMREFGLILANVDGLEAPTEKFVMRSVPHMLGLAQSIQTNATEAPLEMTGWSGDGAPGGGTLRDFSTGAVIQHFTKSLNRVEGKDFRLPTEAELDAMEAFMLSIGRQEELDLQSLRLTNPDAELGRTHFITEDSANRTLPAAKCNICHRNAGALTVADLNVNFSTGTENMPHAADLTGEPRPRDDGFGTNPNASTGGFGDGTFNTASLVEAADTAPYFHHNGAATLEDAIRHYDSAEFKKSTEGRRLQLQDTGGQELTIEIDALAAFLRVINVMENIRSSVDAMSRAQLAATVGGSEQVMVLALADLGDTLEVLSEGELHEESFILLENSLAFASAAADAGDPGERNTLLENAIVDALTAESLMVASSVPLPDTTAPTVSITNPAEGSSVSGTVSIAATASDNEALDRLIFTIDQTEIGQDTAAPFVQTWDTAIFADGARQVKVTAIDTSGNTKTASVAVTVNNAPTPPADTTPPSVSILSPLAGDTVSGTVTISANATDDTAVDVVVFKVGQTEIGRVSLPPFDQAWDTTAFPEGANDLTVIAFDPSGNSATAGISVTVDNVSSEPCTVYSCPNPPEPPSDPPPDPTSSGSPDGEFENEVVAVDLDASTVTVAADGGTLTVKITNKTRFKGSIATAIHEILIGQIVQGEFFTSTSETVWIEADMPPGF